MGIKLSRRLTFTQSQRKLVERVLNLLCCRQVAREVVGAARRVGGAAGEDEAEAGHVAAADKTTRPRVQPASWFFLFFFFPIWPMYAQISTI